MKESMMTSKKLMKEDFQKSTKMMSALTEKLKTSVKTSADVGKGLGGMFA